MLTVIGVDPGVTTGVAVFEYGKDLGKQPRVSFYQADVIGTPWLLEQLVKEHTLNGLIRYHAVVIAVESYVAGRHGKGSEGTVTREFVALCDLLASRYNAKLVRRNAGTVKPWATDVRFPRSGLLSATEGMRHARDAARHALFAAVHDFGVPDPLSRKAANA